MCQMKFGGDVVHFDPLEFRKVDVPQSPPILPILPFFGPCVCDAVRGVMSDFQTTVGVGASQV